MHAPVKFPFLWLPMEAVVVDIIIIIIIIILILETFVDLISVHVLV